MSDRTLLYYIPLDILHQRSDFKTGIVKHEVMVFEVLVTSKAGASWMV